MRILKKMIFLLIFICGYLINVVNATNQSIVKLSTNKKIVQIGEEIELTIDIDNLTAAFTIYLEFDNTKLDYISGPENTNLINNKIIHVWYDKTGGKGKKRRIR